MRGMLWQNTVAAGFIIVIYFVAMLTIQYIYSIFNATPILNAWQTTEPSYVQLFLNLFLYFVIPVVIIVVFIVFTKPQQEVVVLGG